MKRWFVMLCSAGIVISGLAEVTLPKIIGSRMVLQRGVTVPVWGWADAGEAVTVAFANQVKTAMPDENGKWMVNLEPMAASAKPRTMKVSGENDIDLEDVLVGEVWLASGQSNMEWTFSGLVQTEKDFAGTHKDNRRIRFFHVERHLEAGVPMDDTLGRWKTCREFLPPNVHSVSAVGFFFALELQQELGVPVAILDANWGGQRIEPFIPDEGFKALELQCRKHPFNRDPNVVKAHLQTVAASVEASVQAAEKGIMMPYITDRMFGWSENFIYNAMIAPLAPYALRGAIWYQGESNRGANDYFKKLQALSAGWSQVFHVKDIPLYQVQIAPFDYTYGQNPADSTLCDTIWTAQYRGAQEIPGMGLVAVHDTEIDIHNIHPARKRPVGERLAALALKNQYRKDVVAAGPSFAAAKCDGKRVIVSFNDIGQGLVTTDGEAPSWFELSEDGNTFITAVAAIKGDRVEVQADGVAAPAFVRMGWYDIAIPNLADKNGWPVFAFAAKPVE